MTPIPLIIVEDEAPARAKLVHYVQQDERFDIVGLAQNGQQALSLLEEKSPDIMLLDIQMPGMTGFDVLRLMKNRDIAVIFTTAYEQYAIDAFNASAIDYVLKPITRPRLKMALDKAYNYLGIEYGQKINKLLGLLSQKECSGGANGVKRLAVRKQNSIQLLLVDDIAFIQTQHRLVNVYDRQFNRYWTNELLGDLAMRLPEHQFMRVHRGTIVNLSAPFRMESWNSGRLRIHISDNHNEKTETLVVSRDYAKKLKQRLSD